MTSDKERGHYEITLVLVEPEPDGEISTHEHNGIAHRAVSRMARDIIDCGGLQHAVNDGRFKMSLRYVPPRLPMWIQTSLWDLDPDEARNLGKAMEAHLDNIRPTTIPRPNEGEQP